MSKERQSNFELLRIIAILLITFHHIAFNTGILKMNGSNRVIADFLVIGGKFGVNIFVLISSYFLCKKNIKFSKIIQLVFQVLFYSLLLYFLALFLFQEEFHLKAAITFFFPIIFKKWWFVTAIIALYVIHPFLNLLIKNLSEKKYLLFLAISTLFLSIIPTFLNQEIYYSDFLWFVYLYFIGAYLRIYGEERFSYINRNVFWLFSLFNYFVIFLSIEVFGVLGQDFAFFRAGHYHFISQTSFFLLLSSISLFYYFKTISLSSSFINQVSKLTFGVYLIQSHPLFNKGIYQFFQSILDSSYFWIYSIFYCMCLFVMCFLLDYIYRKIVLNIIYKKGVMSTSLYKNLEKVFDN